jgi:hypothetical protein
MDAEATTTPRTQEIVDRVILQQAQALSQHKQQIDQATSELRVAAGSMADLILEMHPQTSYHELTTGGTIWELTITEDQPEGRSLVIDRNERGYRTLDGQPIVHLIVIPLEVQP